MKFKKILCLSLISSFILTSCGSNNREYTFKYATAEDKSYNAVAYYEDDYFSKDGSIYNPSLSTCSMSLSMSAFNGENISDGYLDRDINASNFLKNYGFNKIYVNDGYKNKPTASSVGIIIGQKKIENKTLIAVAIRGKNYETEWANNVKFGDGKEVLGHQGFFEASKEYLKELENYISSNSISGEIKLWSVGYSRGGAINNIALGQIDKMISQNTSLFNKVTLQKEDVYGYCFDAPMGVSSTEEISPKDKMYNNIHNVINSNNIYTKIGFKQFDFTLYGSDYYLPDSTKNASYKQLIAKMKDYYEDLQAKDTIGDYTIDDFSLTKEENASYSIINNRVNLNYNVSLYLDEFLETVAFFGIQSQENYYTNYQEGLEELLSVIFKNGTPKFTLKTLAMNLVRYLISSSNVDIYINNLLNDTSAFIKDFLVLLRSNLVSLGLDIKAETLSTTLNSFLHMLASIFILNSSFLTSLLNTTNIKAILEATNPEIVLAHLMALDPNYNSSIIDYNSDGSYYLLSVNSCSENTKIVIKDSNNVIVGKLEGGYFDINSSLTGGNYSSQVYFYIPVEQVYQIEINEATSYSLTYFDQTSFNYGLEEYSKGEVNQGIDIKTTTYPEKNK